MNTLLCVKCNKEKSLESFAKASRNVKRGGLQSYCKECMFSYGKQHRKDHADHYRQRQRNAYSTSLVGRLKALLKVTSSDRSLLSFDWCWTTLEQQDFKCAITKIPLSHQVRSPTAMSIDRIDPNKGYTEDNIRFVCWWINAAMGNWGLEKLKEFINEWELNAGQPI